MANRGRATVVMVAERAGVSIASVSRVLNGVATSDDVRDSVLRAAVMGGVGLLGALAARRAQALPALGAAVVVVLLFWPQMAVGPGFALSVSPRSGWCCGRRRCGSGGWLAVSLSRWRCCWR